MVSSHVLRNKTHILWPFSEGLLPDDQRTFQFCANKNTYFSLVNLYLQCMLWLQSHVAHVTSLATWMAVHKRFWGDKWPGFI